MALSAVVLPAPFGPISPRIRPSGSCRSTPSSATVVPNDFRRPSASMHVMASPLFPFGLRWQAFSGAVQQVFRLQSKPLDGCVNLGPPFLQKVPALSLEQHFSRARIHKHPQAPPALHQLFSNQFLIALQDRERIHAIFSRDVSYRRQGVDFLQHPFQDHRHHTVAKLAVDRLTVVPLTVHLFSQLVSAVPLNTTRVTWLAAGQNARGSACPRPCRSSPRCGGSRRQR